MGTFAAMLGSYFVSCEGYDYGNKPIDLAFQNRIVIKFSSLFAACFFCYTKSFYKAYLYQHFVSEISFSFDDYKLFFA